MINTRALTIALNELRATESRSLVHHLEGTAAPYLTAKTMPIWRKLRALEKISIAQEHRLRHLLARLDLPVTAVTFTVEVANYHYITVPTAIPLLIAEKKTQIASYERALSHAGTDESVNSEIMALLAENREQLTQLEGFQAQLPADQPTTYKP